MDKVKNILILDDIPSLAELIQTWLRQEYKRNEMAIECFNEDEHFKGRIEHCNPDDTLLMINASFKRIPESYRYELHGIKGIVKSSLRIECFKRHPIVAYSTIPEEELLNPPIGKIFVLNQYHKYLNLIKVKEIRAESLFNTILAIPDEKALRAVINEYCVSELKEFIGDIVHGVLKNVKLLKKSEINILDKEKERKKIISSLEHLQKVLYEDYINKLNAKGIIELLKNYKPRNKNAIERGIDSIIKKLKLFCKNKGGYLC